MQLNQVLAPFMEMLTCLHNVHGHMVQTHWQSIFLYGNGCVYKQLKTHITRMITTHVHCTHCIVHSNIYRDLLLEYTLVVKIFPFQGVSLCLCGQLLHVHYTLYKLVDRWTDKTDKH